MVCHMFASVSRGKCWRTAAGVPHACFGVSHGNMQHEGPCLPSHDTRCAHAAKNENTYKIDHKSFTHNLDTKVNSVKVGHGKVE